MIKTFEQLFKMPESYKIEFLENCAFSEKIAAFYFHVKILSDNLIKFYKSDHQEIRNEDIILNRMWQMPVHDFTRIFLMHPEFTKKHIGYTFSFFFFPVTKPFFIEYKDNFRYVIANIQDKYKKQVNPDTVNFHELSSLIRNNSVNITNKKRNFTMETLSTPESAVKSILSFFHNKDIPESCCKNNYDNAEGIIMRWKGNNYQIILNNPTPKEKSKFNRLPLEYILKDFSGYLGNSKNNCMALLDDNDPVKNICNLFSGYMKSADFNYYKISAEDLKSPNFGYYSGTGYEFIPSAQVRKICQENILADNIFKVILNAMRRYHKINKTYMILNSKELNIINKFSKIIYRYNFKYIL